VKFLGVRHDVPELLGASNVFALTSVSEAASLTLLEAMASALPVVVTQVGGNPEIVREGVDGFMVRRGDASAATRRMLSLLEDPARALVIGESGRQRVRDHFNLADVIERYYQRYEAAVRRLRGQSPQQVAA